MPQSIDRLRPLLGHRGGRLTSQRRAVRDVLTSSPRGLTPAEVYEQVRRQGGHIGLTTVYRTIELLSQLGLVRRVHEESGCHRYVAYPKEHRHYLVCSDCGMVEEFTECPLDQWAQSLSQATRFDIWEHRLEFIGRCQRCQEKAGAGW